MPEPVTEAQATALRDATIGFCGKLPARGDFVAAGLPRHFVEPWHDWMQRVLAPSRAILGEAWLAAWLEAPVWRFVLAPGLCGPDPALGLWMPSVDRIGRHFPLTFAALVPGCDACAVLHEAGGFLAAAEEAGRDALSCDLAPDALAGRTSAASLADPSDCGIDPEQWPRGGALWWSEGSSRVPGGMFATASLPDDTGFAAMLDARVTVSGARE